MKNDRSSSSAPQGMALADFSIGMFFVSGGYIWLCTNVGARTIIVLRMSRAKVSNAALLVGREKGVRHDGSLGTYVESLFGEDDFPDCATVAVHAVSGTDECLERIRALTDSLALEVAQRLGIEAESAILVALVRSLRQSDDRATLTQRIARVQALARATGIEPCLTDHKTLMDDMWGES